jgi:hypothetical protein
VFNPIHAVVNPDHYCGRFKEGKNINAEIDGCRRIDLLAAFIEKHEIDEVEPE